MTKSAVRSMTAFSRCETLHEGSGLAWEIRSVNHRYLDTSLRLPDSLRSLEPAVRELLRKQLARGKVDCTLQLSNPKATQETLRINEPLLDQYLEATARINTHLRKREINTAAISATELLFRPGVIEQNELDAGKLGEIALELFHKALAEHIAHREREGLELTAVIQQRLDRISELVRQLKPMIPAIVQQQKDKLLAKLTELKAELNPDRLEQEITLLAQRVDVDEELDRLNTHITEVQRAFNDGGSVGRRLDFLMQELNRETNTLSSKSISSETTLIAVDMKVLIEQMREQIQNLE